MNGTYAWADHRVFPARSSGEKTLLFGAADASLFAIESSAQEALEAWRQREALILDQAPCGDREILEALRDAHLLVRPEHVARSARAIDPVEIPLGTLVLEAAQACNLRCTYCYAGGGSYGGATRIMRPELARRAACFLVESSGNRETVTLVLFGGEPLLNLPALEAAVSEGEATAAALGKRLVVSMTTNGTRFTPAALDFLAAHRIGITVSIDGPPEIHDANRRHAGAGAGTYADVVAGLAQLRERTSLSPAARVTLTPNQWHRVPEVFDHVVGLGFLEVGIAPSSPVRAELLPTPEQQEALLDGFAILAERLEREASAGRVLPFSNLLDLLARLHLGQAKSAPCGAGLGYLAIDAEGSFFLCHRLAGQRRFRVGDIDRGIDHDRIRACLAEQTAPRADTCARCWARSLCAGGCHYENHLRESELGLAPGGSCEFIRRWIERGIRVYARLCDDADESVLAFLGRRVDS